MHKLSSASDSIASEYAKCDAIKSFAARIADIYTVLLMRGLVDALDGEEDEEDGR